MGVRGKRKLTLPRVFIGGRYIGSAEEIRQMHEAGELKQYVEGLPSAKPGRCEVCGGHRFLLCADCDGSRKYYSEKARFRVCKTCDENGLISWGIGGPKRGFLECGNGGLGSGVYATGMGFRPNRWWRRCCCRWCWLWQREMRETAAELEGLVLSAAF